MTAANLPETSRPSARWDTEYRLHSSLLASGHSLTEDLPNALEAELDESGYSSAPC